MGISRQLGRLMPNLRGPTEKKKKLYANTINSIMMYGVSIWGDAVTVSKKLQNKLQQVQRVLAIRVIFGYRTVSVDSSSASVGQDCTGCDSGAVLEKSLFAIPGA